MNPLRPDPKSLIFVVLLAMLAIASILVGVLYPGGAPGAEDLLGR